MSFVMIGGGKCYGTDGFCDFNTRGASLTLMKESTQGASFGDPSDYADTKEARLVGTAYQISRVGYIDMTRETFEAQIEIKYIYRIDAADVDKYRKFMKGVPAGGFQEMCDSGDLKCPPPIIEFRNAVDSAANIREQVTSVDYMRPQQGLDGYYVTLTGEYRMQCHESIRLQEFPFSRQALQVRLVCKQQTGKVMLAPYCFVAPPWKFARKDEPQEGMPQPSAHTAYALCPAAPPRTI